MLRTLTLAMLALSLTLSVAAQEAAPDAAAATAVPAAAPAEPAAAEPAPPPPSNWTHRFQIGAFLSGTDVGQSTNSLDASIKGAQRNATYTLKFDGSLKYQRDRHTVDQTILMQYGERKTELLPAEENVDEINYDGSYDVKLGTPHQFYVSWGLDSVFVGPLPDEQGLDPIVGKASIGYGQRFEKLAGQDANLLWRAGARVQESWGDSVAPGTGGPESGWEFIARYEGKRAKTLAFQLQYEVFGEFDDPGHIRQLATAKCSLDLTKLLKLEFGLRLYNEGRPDDAAVGALGYDEWSFTETVLLGLTYQF